MVAYHDDEWGTPVHDDIELFERLGFARDAVLRDNAFEDGRYHDSYIYSLIRSGD